MLNHVQKLKLQNSNGIVLCKGINGKNENFWVYVKADKKGIEAMHADYDNGRIVDFLNYGQIIKFGLSDEPPENIRQFMEVQYNFKHE